MTAVQFEKKGGAITATQAWSNREVSCLWNTPVLKDGRLYCLSVGGGGGRGARGGGMRGGGGKFACVDAKNGATLWLDEKDRGSTYGGLVDVGAVILALTSNSQLAVIEPDGKAYKEAATYKVSDKATYAYPVPCTKGVIIRDQESVALWGPE